MMYAGCGLLHLLQLLCVAVARRKKQTRHVIFIAFIQQWSYHINLPTILRIIESFSPVSELDNSILHRSTFLLINNTPNYAVLSTKFTSDTLILSTVICPSSTMYIQIAFERWRWRLTEWVEVFSISVSVDVDRYPMFTRTIRRMYVSDEQFRTTIVLQ